MRNVYQTQGGERGEEEQEAKHAQAARRKTIETAVTHDHQRRGLEEAITKDSS